MVRGLSFAGLGFALLGFTGCIPHLESSGGGDEPWVAPENGWELTSPPAELAGEGYEEGQVVPDFRLVDQFGDEVSLWQFYGNIILLDISTIWCAPCQELASHAEQTWLDYRDQGFMHVTVLHEDLEGNPPDKEDLNEWVEAFGLTSPVLGDGDRDTLAAILNGQYPTVLLVDRKMTVLDRVSTHEQEVREAIESAL